MGLYFAQPVFPKGYRILNAVLLKVVIFFAITSPSAVVRAENDGGQPSGTKAIFDPNFLMQASGTEIDVSRFENGTPLEPGEYRADTYLNNKFTGRETVFVRTIAGKAKVCVQKNTFNKIGLNSDAINYEALGKLTNDDACQSIEDLSPVAKAQFDSAQMRLDIHVPQANMQHNARGSVDPAMWDEGVNALLLGYNTNYYQSEINGKELQSFYGGTNLGYNIGGWMFRHSGSLFWQEGERRSYRSIRNYVEHDITPLKSRLTLGDANTAGDIFDTFAFRGVEINTVERMLPDSRRGYAPVVRGVAQTNAHVTIEQNGALLYDTTVPPGPFVIDDLYPTGYGGDLNVKVTEADGRESTFSVPYAAVAQLLRPGETYYSAMAGTLRDFNLSSSPRVGQLTLQHGLSNSFTGYGGLLSAKDYNAGLAGLAISTPAGALALDITHARVATKGEGSQGNSFRATFSKMYAETGSSISIAAYRFSSSGYLDLRNAMLFSDYYRFRKDDNTVLRLQRPRNRLSLTASQTFREGWGQIYISGFSQNYWGRSGNDNQYQIGYSNNLKRLTYTLSANRVKDISGDSETKYLLSFSLPLGDGTHSPGLNMNMSHSSQGIDSQLSLNGIAGANDQFNYNVSAARDVENNNSGSLTGVYRSPYSALQASYGQGNHYHSVSAGATGSLVVLSDSITASPYATDTMAVITAPDAAGARVEGYSGVILNGYGNAIVPYLNPYRLNEVSLNPSGLQMDVELQNTSQQVVPRSGAVVKLNYATITGRPVLLNVISKGVNLPLGAVVRDKDGNAVGTVAQGNVVYARLAKNTANLKISWGTAKNESCTIKVNLPDRKPTGSPYQHMDSQCR